MCLSNSLDSKPRIIFLSVTNMNSTKAYTITINNTLEAVIKNGFTTSLVAPDINFFDFGHCKSRILSLLQYVQTRARVKFNSRSFFVRSINFIIFETSFLLIIRLKRVITDTDIIWTRSFLASIILGSRRKYLLEIHQPLSLWQKGLLLVQKLMGTSLILAPISKNLESQVFKLPMKFQKVIQLPMAVNRNFLNLRQPESDPKFQIGYFGSLRTNSEDQGIFELIEQLIVCRDFNPRFNCLMVGLDKSEIHEVQKYLSNLKSSIGWISFYPRLEHVLIPSLMQSCRYLVAPYLENKFNAARFPLKLLEYASCFRIILASDTTANRNIFSKDEVFFYDNQDRLSIHKSLEFIKAQSKDISAPKSMKAYKKATEYSYSKRAQIALEALDLIRIKPID